MKVRKRILSALLAASMLFSASAPAWAVEGDGGSGASQSAVKGEIRATLRLDYAQNLKAIKNHGVTMVLEKGHRTDVDAPSNPIVTVNFDTMDLGQMGVSQKSNSYSYMVTAKNRDGGVMTNVNDNSWPGYLELAVDNLPQGEYTLFFRGRGYATYFHHVTIGEYSQHLIVGTGDKTFTLGDITGEGNVNEEDMNYLNAHSYILDDPKSADGVGEMGFNGDGIVDTIDLAYVMRSTSLGRTKDHIKNNPDAQLLGTRLLVPPVDSIQTMNDMSNKGTRITSGSLNDLFKQQTSTHVTLTSDDKSQNRVEMPITLSQPKEMEQIIVYAHATEDGAKDVSAIVEYEENGKTETMECKMKGSPLPEGVHAIGRAGEDSRDRKSVV